MLMYFVLYLCILLVCRSQLDIRRGERHCSPPAIIRVNRLGVRDVGWEDVSELEQLESEIPALEQQKSELEAALSSGTLSIDELTAASAKIAELIETLEEKEMRWLELSEI